MKKPVAASLILILFLFVRIDDSEAAVRSGLHKVIHVIDGDTVVIGGGRRVRYIGVDTPEAGEPLYEEARDRNRALVGKKNVRLEVCKEEREDRYGRALAMVYSGGVLVNEALVKEGLARRLTIPPCGVKEASRFEKAEKEARARRVGIWGDLKARERRLRTIGAEEAGAHVHEAFRVKGRVADIHRSGKAVFIDIGPKGRGLRAVVFRESFGDFEAAGVDLEGLRGRLVAVSGVIRSYKGEPEMILRRPSQIRAGG